VDEPVETAVPALKAMADGMPMRTIGSPSLVRSRFRLGLVGRVQVVEERTLVDPGSVGDWIPALLMVAALGGLAAACGYALRQEEAEAAAPRPAPLREPNGAVASGARRPHAGRQQH
jgi:hypothetical protein